MPRVLLIVTSEEAAAPQALVLQHELEQSLSRNDGFELIPRDAVVGLPTEKSPELAAAQAAIDEINGLIGQIDYDSARTKAQKAIADARSSDFRITAGAYLELLKLLARIKYATRADDLGVAELVEAFSLDPTTEALRGMNSKELALFDKTKAESLSAPRAREVLVESDVPGLLWVDGQLRGATPLTLTGFSAGRHFLTFSALGATPARSTELFGNLGKLRVTAGPSTEAGKSLRAAMAALRDAVATQRVSAAGKALRDMSGADELWAVVIAGAGTRLVRVTSSGVVTRGSSQPANVIKNDLLALRNETAKAEQEPAPSDAVSTSVPASPPERSRAPGWVTLAVGAGAAIVGGILLASSQVQYNEAGKIPQVEVDRYSGAVQSANGTATGGFIALGAGVVAAGVGVALVW